MPSPRFKSEPRALTGAELRALIDGLRDRRAPLPRGRDRRHRGLDGARLPRRAVLHPALEPAHGRVRRRRPAALRRGGARPPCAPRPGPGWRSASGSRPTSWRRRASTRRRAPSWPARCAPPGSPTSPRSRSGHSAYVAGLELDRAAAAAPRRRAIAGPLALMRAAVGAVPVIGTTRVVDLAAAERLVASGDADAVGMTRALIADPDLVEKARARADRRGARLHRLQPGLHRALPRGGADRLPREPAHRARADAAAPGGRCAAAGRRRRRRRARRASRRPSRRRRTATRSRCIERGADIGGQLRLAGRAPAHRELWRRWHAQRARASSPAPGSRCAWGRRPARATSRAPTS